jgi:hypothetical protein
MRRVATLALVGLVACGGGAPQPSGAPSAPARAATVHVSILVLADTLHPCTALTGSDGLALTKAFTATIVFRDGHGDVVGTGRPSYSVAPSPSPFLGGCSVTVPYMAEVARTGFYQVAIQGLPELSQTFSFDDLKARGFQIQMGFPPAG